MNRAIALLVPLAFVAFAGLAWRADWLCDDAYISFRYARHLAEGKGLVFNPSREVPVEGYSNLLWVLWLGTGEALGLASTTWSRVTSAGCGALLLASVVRFLGRWRGPGVSGTGTAALGPLAVGSAALFLATLPPFSVWSTSGLASMPTALFLFLCFANLDGQGAQPRVLAATFFAVATAWVRADGAVWVCMVLLGIWLGAPQGAQGAARRRSALRVFVALLAAVGLHVLWRYSYYEDVLPLTARVKAGFSTSRLERGLDYIVAWLLIVPCIPLCLLAGLFSVRGLPRSLAVPAALLTLLGSAYAIWVGGDFMPFGRFLFPTLPFIALLFAALIEHLRRVRSAGAYLLTLACIGTSMAAQFDYNLVPESARQAFHFRRDRAWQSELERQDEMDLNARRWVLLGRALDQHTGPEDSLILGGIGAVGYHADLFIYDSYGLVTPEVVAHGQVVEGSSPGHDLRVHPPFFLPQKPTFLGAYLTPRGGLTPEEPLPWWTDIRPPDWSKHRWGELVDPETLPLDPLDGFPENADLVLLRIR